MTEGSERTRIELLRAAIVKELDALDRLPDEARELIEVAAPETMHVRALGSVLHDYYTGVERILKRILEQVDRDVPDGNAWHREVLERTTLQVRGTRPPVLDDTLAEDLGELLGFRHVFRNVYGPELRWGRLRELAETLPNVHRRLHHALDDFITFLGELAGEL